MTPPHPRLDLVHTSPVITAALREQLGTAPGTGPVTTVHSWVDFQREWDFAGDVIVLDAFLDDHVPLTLKVRALRRLGSRVVVLGPGRDSDVAARAAAEGAIAWCEPRADLATTARAVHGAAQGTPPPGARVRPAGPPVARLSDRELQILCLYTSRHGHSPKDIGRILGLRPETIRSHLERGRARYRRAGLPTHNREALGANLVADGWDLAPQAWWNQARS